MDRELSVLEICAGAGGQSLGLEQAGFRHELAVEIDRDAAATLRLNRPDWNVLEGDVRELSGSAYKGVDLLAGGIPCPPFSVAGKQMGAEDERDLFPDMMRLVSEVRPQAVLIENVRGFASARFDAYRESVLAELTRLGYKSDWRVIYSSDHGVPQLRPRFVLVAFRDDRLSRFEWPELSAESRTVGQVLHSDMASQGWKGADAWALGANDIAPTVVGGSKKHGGADLGPTRAKQAWLRLGVDGRGIADQVPGADDPVDLIPRLTNQMVARIQGFPAEWQFSGKKTSVYRQIGNAFPAPVAAAVGRSVRNALAGVSRRHVA